MIKYQLVCDQKHEFEGWFQGSAAFDEQAANGLLRCPLCDSDQVKRALMTPNLASPKRRKSTDPSACDSAPRVDPTVSAPAAPAPVPPSLPPAVQTAGQGRAAVMPSEQVQAFGAALAELRQLRRNIIKDCRDVGDNFAEEARKIHYGEADAEGIYGQASREEREALKDEGIEIFDMPWVPSDH
jgi:hypothetical protein